MLPINYQLLTKNVSYKNAKTANPGNFSYDFQLNTTKNLYVKIGYF